MDRGQLVDLLQHRATRVKQWSCGSVKGPHAQSVVIGQLDDGRWYVEWISRVLRPGIAYRTREEAETAARWVMDHHGEGWA